SQRLILADEVLPVAGVAVDERLTPAEAERGFHCDGKLRRPGEITVQRTARSGVGGTIDDLLGHAPCHRHQEVALAAFFGVEDIVLGGRLGEATCSCVDGDSGEVSDAEQDAREYVARLMDCHASPLPG